MTLKKVFRVLLDICVVTAIILFVPGIPPRVKFESYDLKPPMELIGPLEPNGKLDKAEFLYEGKFTGAESIAVKDGHIYAGLIGGDVVKIDKITGEISVVARFGNPCEGKWQESICGRPLGLRFDSDRKLVANDAYYGIFRVDVDTGKVEQLVASKDPVDGRPLMVVNDLDIAPDGTIYFSDSSQFTLQNTLLELLGEPTGRLLKYDPKTKKTTVLLKNLHFANGVQLSRDQSFVLVAETFSSKIMKYHLKGEKAGSSEIFIDGLPGVPDNIRSDEKGGFLVSLNIQKTLDHPSLIDRLCHYPLLRKLIARITSIMHAVASGIDSIVPNEYTGKAKYYINHLEPFANIQPVKGSNIVQLDNYGKVKSSLQSSNGKVAFISEVTIDDKGMFAYMGSPYNHGIWRIKVSDMELK